MFAVLIKIVNFIISLDRKTSQAMAHIKSRIGEFENISATNVAECSMIEQILSLIIFAKMNLSLFQP